MKHEKLYTALDVLDLYVEFAAMQPNTETWTDGGLQDNPPRFYRLKMLRSLFRAFDVGDPKKFAEGDFIVRRKTEDYHALIKRMKSELKAVTRFHKGELITLKEIAFLFQRLLAYRSRWDSLTGFSSGLYACSAKYRYAFYKIDQVNSQIRDNIAPVNDILTTIISPTGKTISKEELVKDFDYPDVDVLDIDVDHI